VKAGFASTCITPALGKEIPGLFERRFAEGVRDDLYARAAVIDDGRCCVAFVQTDTIKVSEQLVAAARKRAQRLCGIPGKNCFISATHTHSGGPTFAGLGTDADADYAGFVAERVADAIAEAHRRRRPAYVGTGSAAAEGVAFNRRFVMRDGTQMTHPGKMNPSIVRPAGPADPTVTVVGCCDPSTLTPFGCIVHFACHATHMNGYLYSADYMRWIVDMLWAVYGRDLGVTCLNGACGDVTQMDNQSARPGEFGPYWCERTGRVVGAGALQALARMDYFKKATVAREASTAPAAVRRSSAAERRAARALLAEKEVTGADVETIYARELLQVESMRRKKPVHSLEIMGIRVADALFWGVPGEYFQKFAMDVRAASRFPHTCCVELANGYNGYICTEDAFAGGGYEVRTARSSFLEVTAGERIVKTATRLCERMYQSASREIAALPGRRTWPKWEDSALDGINQLKAKK